MKKILLFLSLTSLFCRAESLQTLTVLGLSSTNVAGLAWVDKHGGFHALNTTNIVTEAYVAGLLAGYQIGSDILSNFVALGNGAGMLTNDGAGNISWVIPVSGGGSQTPWLAMEDAAYFPLTNLYQLLMTDDPFNIADTARITVNNAFTLQGVAAADAAYFSQNMYYDGTSDLPIDDVKSSSRFLMINLPGYVNDPNGGAFNWQIWTSGAGPITWTSLMQLTPDGVLRVGSNSDDSSSALVQSAGSISAAISYWVGGVEGASGFSILGDDALMHPVVGGIIQ